MRRTTVAVASFLLLLLVGQAAGAQTTTSSTSTSAPASSATTTSTPTGGGAARPPGAVLSSSAGQVDGLRGSSCWRQPGATTGVCADTLFLDPSNVLAVRQGESLTLRFATTASPTSITVERFAGPNTSPAGTLAVPAGNPARFAADLPAGVWILVAFTRWDEGDATYYFKVDVRAASGSPNPSPPAKPTPAPPRFTG